MMGLLDQLKEHDKRYISLWDLIEFFEFSENVSEKLAIEYILSNENFFYLDFYFKHEAYDRANDKRKNDIKNYLRKYHADTDNPYFLKEKQSLLSDFCLKIDDLFIINIFSELDFKARLCFYVSVKNNLFNIVIKPFSIFEKGNFAIGLTQKETEKFLNDGVLIHLADLEKIKDTILSDLETFNKFVSEFHERVINPNQNSETTENYITLNETLGYLKKSLDLSINDPINFLEKNIKQGIIIPYFEFFGFINFETPTNDYTTVIQIDEVHGYFKDWNYSLPNNEFTNLSKDEYQIVNGFVEKLFFADCHKFYGRSKNGNLHYEPNKAIELPKNTNVTFHSIRPSIDYETLLVRDNLQTRENEKVFISNNAIHFKLTEIDNLISQNSHLKVKQISQNDNDLLKKVETQQITINSLNQELDKLRAELSAIQQVSKETKPTQSDTPAEGKQLSNVEINNIFTKAILANNNILAKLIKALDYRDLISRDEVANFINPYMWEMALVLSDGDEQKAENLLVTNKTIMDNHLKGVNFKKGARSKQIKEKSSIDLIINRDELS